MLSRKVFCLIRNLHISSVKSLRGSLRPVSSPTESEDVQEKLPTKVENTLPSENPLKSYVPTFNLAAYVNKSECLQEFIKMGVNLHNIERRKGLGEFVLNLNFNDTVKPRLLFLADLGVSPELFGRFITKNPLIFKESIADLTIRVNYLESKKFTPQQIITIVERNPFWLMFSTKRIDNRLGFFQKNFELNGDDVRFLTTKQPNLITYKIEHVQKALFTVKEEMGFNVEEMKCLLLAKPKLFMMDHSLLVERFSYAHDEMKLSHEMILNFPHILTSRQFRVEQRHKFLKFLEKAQYDPKKDLYVSPKALVEGTDLDFVLNVAKSDLVTFDAFLRTL
ncbi:MTERFD1 family protein [Megaselia abdita]